MIGLSVVKIFPKEDKNFGFNRIGYWLHSIACGVLAKQICVQAGIQESEDAFTIGLLHDIGKIILDDSLAEEYQPVIRKACTENMTLYDAEIAVLCAKTFCTFLREFSPLGLREGRAKENTCAVGDDARAGRFSRR